VKKIPVLTVYSAPNFIKGGKRTLSKTSRKKRILTAEILRRRRLFGKLKELGITFNDLEKQTGLDKTTFSKALWNDSDSPEAIAFVKEAIRAKEKDLKSRKPVALQYI
jgi:cyanate lyase